MPLDSFRPKEHGLYGRRSYCYACEDMFNDILGKPYATEYTCLFKEISDDWWYCSDCSGCGTGSVYC